MIITIPGKPIHKERPRFVRGRVYNPQKKEEEAFAWEVMKQLDPWPEGHARPLLCPVALVLEFVMPIPVSTSKKRRKQMLGGLIKHVKVPDLDNLEKFCLDGLEGLLFKNDSQVWWCKSIKRYGDNPRTVITEREV